MVKHNKRGQNKGNHPSAKSLSRPNTKLPTASDNSTLSNSRQEPVLPQHNTATSATDRTQSVDVAPNSWVRMKLSAELLEDTHLGSGSGGGGIDALVARDRQGRPVIWASHIEGILRDATERLHGADVAADFFGHAGGQQQRVLFTSLYTGSDPQSRIWRFTARASFDNRAPLDDTLRVMEYIPQGTAFTGMVELPLSDLPLLSRLLQEVDAVGRGRASGSGRVRLSLVEETMSPCPIGNPTQRLVLLLRNLDPVCITATATPDNLIPSLAFLPGRAMLGALASWLIAEGHVDVATLLVNGRVSISDAVPLPHVPQTLALAEALPAPLTLQREKPGGSVGPAPWWALEPTKGRRIDSSSDEAKEFKAQGHKLKRPEPDLIVYRGTSAEPWIAFRPQLRVRLRSGRPDPHQLEPSLFAIEQIVEETPFLCEICGVSEEMDQLATALTPVLEGSRWLRVGRGGAPIQVEHLAWVETPTPTVVSSPALLILTLTSDLLIRDEYLRWRTQLDDESLRQLPGWPTDVRLSPIVQDIAAVYGFNGTARLWRMPAYGVRRGSVFRVEGDGVAELARMVADGRWLGERTHEGFGRFRLDNTLPGVTDGASTTVTATSSPLNEPEETIATTTHQWLQAHSNLAKTGSASDRRPSLSQWLDLVGDLEQRKPDALTSRLNPTTAGGKSWNYKDAKSILETLEILPDADSKIVHARLFVRWLRAEMRKNNV